MKKGSKSPILLRFFIVKQKGNCLDFLEGTSEYIKAEEYRDRVTVYKFHKYGIDGKIKKYKDGQGEIKLNIPGSENKVSFGYYGEEAINAIVQEMENRRDEVIVIFAGYSDRMKEFFDKNEGMKSRINYFIKFSDYDYKSLYRIFEKIVRDKDFRIGNGVQKFLLSELSKLTKKKDFSSLGNGRYIRKLVEKSILNLNYRIGKLNKDKYSKAELFTIELCDIKNAMNDDIICNESKNGKIGFVA